MPPSDLIIREDDHGRLVALLDKLRADSNAKLTFLLNKNGQELANSGEMEGIDPTSLASLTAGNVAATEGLAELIGEEEFSILFHEGNNDSLHINTIGGKTILLVQFDERSSLGLVRLRVKAASDEIRTVLDEITERSNAPAQAHDTPSPFAEITDEDIDALFG